MQDLTNTGQWATVGGSNNFNFYPQFDPIYMKALARCDPSASCAALVACHTFF